MVMDTELRRLLIETACAGAGHGLHQEAETILKALELNGGQALPVAVVRAILLMSKNRLDEAERQLAPLISEAGEASEADAFMAMVKLKQGQPRLAEPFLQRCQQAGETLAVLAEGLRRDFSAGASRYGF